MNVRSWAAKWIDLDKLAVALFTREGIKVDLVLGRKMADALARDFTRTDLEGDDEHRIHHDQLEAPVIFAREDALGLRNALVSLLERGILASPQAGYFKPELKLRHESLIQIITPQKGRWI